MTTTIKPGDTINQYRIVKELGEGTSTQVFLATHTFLNIDRVIKVLHKDSPKITPDMFDAYCARYKLEWQLAASVRHDNLVEVYDLFEHDSTLFAVMEYASGGTLESRLQMNSKQPEDWVVEVMKDCAKGLQELHQLRNPPVIHCYVSPNTIVLDMNGRAEITNFGRARTNISKLHKEKTEKKHAYNSKYQAPEFSRGKVAPTTDVYSLGCVAFRMLTGQDVAEARVHSPKQIEQTVPRWLDEIIVKCLSDDACFSKSDAGKPNKRYYDMAEFLEALNKPQYLSSDQLQDKLGKYCSLEDLKTICFKLKIDHEEIPAKEEKSAFAREMIRHFQNRQRIGELIEYLRNNRPEINW